MVGLGSIAGALLVSINRSGAYETIIDVKYIICGINEKFSYLKAKNVRKKIVSLFKSKARNGVILITASAVCQFLKIQGIESCLI